MHRSLWVLRNGEQCENVLEDNSDDEVNIEDDHDDDDFDYDEGVANDKCETLRDGETSVFLCEPEIF